MDNDGHISQCSGYTRSSVCFLGFLKADTQSKDFIHRNFSITIKMALPRILTFENFIFEYFKGVIHKRLYMGALLLILIPSLFLDSQDSFLIKLYSKQCIQKRKKSAFMLVNQYFQI
jgi:hypothetical protein